jgi:tRNA threonylcarbamoyladenosine biosynthesis protein TsaE
MLRSLAVTSTSPEETRILGAALAPVLLPGDVVSLSGDLGAGKTVLVQGVATALGVIKRVTSPSFAIVHEYYGRYRIVHIDVYRLNSFQEVLDLGFEELFDPEGIMVVEWGEAVAPMLPPRYLDIDIRRSEDLDAEDNRDIAFRPRGHEWVDKLEIMRKTAETLLDAASPEDSRGDRFRYTATPISRDDRGALG